MKLKLHTAAALIAVAALVSCAGSNDKEYIDKSVIPSGSENTATQPAVPAATTQNTSVVPANTVPGTVIPGTNSPANFQPQPNTVNLNPQANNIAAPQPVAIQPVATQQPATVAAGMNPAHGQPGHRCDISVGAPLNSKPPAPPAVTAQPTTVTTTPAPPSNVTVKEVPSTVKTAPGMNPPHGEPGHRCDISVGAPLNSKPATPAATPAQTPTPPALLTAPKTDTGKN